MKRFVLWILLLAIGCMSSQIDLFAQKSKHQPTGKSAEQVFNCDTGGSHAQLTLSDAGVKFQIEGKGPYGVPFKPSFDRWQDIWKWHCEGEYSGYPLAIHDQHGYFACDFRRDDLIRVVKILKKSPIKDKCESCPDNF